MRISDWSSDVCSSDLVSSAVSASKPSNRRRDRPRTGQVPVHARPAKPAVAATWHHRGMSDALPAGSTLADAVAMPRVDGASRAVLVGISGGLDSAVLLHLLCARPESRTPGLRGTTAPTGLRSAAAHWPSHARALAEPPHRKSQ